MIKLISWNVRKVGEKIAARQADALCKQEPDIIALQDVNIHAAARYEEEFSRIGLVHTAHTFQENSEHTPSGVFIASRFPLHLLPETLPAFLWPREASSFDKDTILKHWKKRTMFVTVDRPFGAIDLYNVYITPFNHKERTPAGERKLYQWIKFDLLSSIYSTLSAPIVSQTVLTDRPRILCGDFNTPREEMPDGKIITWGYSGKNGKYFLTPAGRTQHELEHNILRGLENTALCPMHIVAFMGMLRAKLMRHGVGKRTTAKSTASITFLLLRLCLCRIFAICMR
ncbi:MAG TPA: endonuclease/exonuclease/phosphatase family protein [Ktedonobacteraceae bacterium]|nr:endonuclease/exonuclease/phosphatase family protein [Ktedonobacteraceae bacterium]